MKRPRREGPVKLFVGVIWIGGKPGERISVWADSPNAAREQVEAQYGKGHVISLHNEHDADRPRPDR
jgi:hypothetical protein